MAICRDPVLGYLNDQGYNVVRLPRSGIEPLDILGRNGKHLERLGSLSQIWASAVEAPGCPAPLPAAAINGKSTGDLKLSIGLRLLNDVLGALGANVPDLNFAYRMARSIQIGFVETEVVTIDPFIIGNYLSAGDLNTRNPFVSRYFEDDDLNVYVIFEILKSKKLAVTAKSESTAKVSVDVATIQDTVGADIEVAGDFGLENLITYTGKISLTFGFKVFELFYDNGDWRVQGLAPSPDFAFGSSQAGTQSLQPALLSSSGRISLK